jgi:dolichyl-diphosphooligosaccharide--protein glycosyltransferase
MSGLTEQFARATEDKSVLELLREHYHVPLLALAVTFSLWVRTRGWQTFLRDGRVLFSGNDAWYHYRSVQWTVKNWPFTMPFDPWTRFPGGTSVGQFGTLFDQLVATAALIVGLGSPTDQQVAMTLLFAPAVFGALALIPAYYLAKRVANRPGALVAVLLLTLTTGQFLTRGVAGFSDHHIAEVFFLTLSVAGLAYALTIAQAEKPIYELFVEREWELLKRPVGWAVLAGLFVSLYLLTWPPGVFLVGILGIYFVIAMSLYQAKGRSPEHVAITGVVVGVVVGVVTLLLIENIEFDAVSLSLIQPALGFALAAGCAFLAGLARLWDEYDVADVLYPVGVAGIGVVGAGLFALVLPDLFGYFVDQVLRIFGHQATPTSRTVAEAQPIPLESVLPFLNGAYGLAVYATLGGFLLVVYELATAEVPRHDHVLILVLTVMLFLAMITQRRFEYYFAIPVAVLTAYLAAWVFSLVSLHEVDESLENLEAYQVMAVVAVLLVVAAPLVVTANSAPAVAENRANPGEVTHWTGSLDWMSDNTPEIGAYGSGGDGTLDYYGSYDRTEDFEYEDGAYGTVSWWDYGHFITVLGERIPNANPFQQNADYAANVLLAPNESTAVDLLRNDGQEETRYVVVDYQMGVPGTRKYSAPAAFETRYNLSDNDADPSNDITRTIRNPDNGRPVTTIGSQRSFESLRVRLYQSNGGRMDPNETARELGQVLVIDYDTQVATIDGEDRVLYFAPEDGQIVKRFNTTAEARDYVESDGDSQIGGIPGYPSEPVPALEHYRLVHASESTGPQQPLGQQYPWVKTFERVPGATVEGEGPANTTVTASVEMEMQNVNGTFVYTQQTETGPDGQFTMTVPYSTSGYDEWGTQEGYTNVSTRAVSNYSFTTPSQTNGSTISRHIARADVPEGKVIGEDDEPVQVTLEEQTIDLSQGNESGDGNQTNVTDANATDGNTTDGNTSDGSGNETGTEGANDTNESTSLAPPRATYTSWARP